MGKKAHIEILLEKIYRHRKIILQSVLEKFQSQNLQPKIGIELELYLQHQGLPANQDLTRKFITHLKSQIFKNNINLLGIEPEQGCGQVEIKTLPYLDILQLCQDVDRIKEITSNLDDYLQVNFLSQPYQNDCGSALQINFSLMQNDDFLFAKKNSKESNYLLHSIAGALHFTKNMMIIFAPSPKDYLRFDLELNRNLYKKQKYTAPVNIGWGYNNRSALIRIPVTQNISERRVEFRLGASSADIYLTNIFFLLATLWGMATEKELLLPEVYGNSFDHQYGLEILPNYEEAKNYFLDSHLTNEILFILNGKKFD